MSGGGGGGGGPSRSDLDIRPAATRADTFQRTYQQGPYNPDGSYNPNLEWGFGYQRPPSYDGYMSVGNTPMAPYTPNWGFGGGMPYPGSGASQLSNPWMKTYGGGLNQGQYMYGGFERSPMFGFGGMMQPFMAGGNMSWMNGPQPGVNPGNPFGGGGNFQNTSYQTQNNPNGFFNGFDFDSLWKKMDEYGQVDPYRQPEPPKPEPEKKAAAAPAPQQRNYEWYKPTHSWSGTEENPHHHYGGRRMSKWEIDQIYDKYGENAEAYLVSRFSPDPIRRSGGPINNGGYNYAMGGHSTGWHPLFNLRNAAS